jgi:putative lipoic acid-binding regulatory protein
MTKTASSEFPTEFPIKVMGRHDSDLRALTREIVERHTGPWRIRMCACAPAATATSWR